MIKIQISYLLDLSSITLANFSNVTYFMNNMLPSEALVIYGEGPKHIAKSLLAEIPTKKNIVVQGTDSKNPLLSATGNYVLKIDPNKIIFKKAILECIRIMKLNKQIDAVLLNRAYYFFREKRFAVDYSFMISFLRNKVVPDMSCAVTRKSSFIKRDFWASSVFYTGVALAALPKEFKSTFLLSILGGKYSKTYEEHNFKQIGIGWLKTQDKFSDKLFLSQKDYKNKTKVILGSAATYQKGFLSTDIDILDVTNERHWAGLFKQSSIDILLAEHVFEHLSIDQIIKSLKLCFKYLKPKGKLRIAIPDKNRKDKVYVREVAPPASEHKSYLSFEELSDILKEVGFKVEPLEYFDSNGKFHARKWSESDGIIKRSIKFDKQKKFKLGKLHYTSLIVDAVKPN